MSPQWWVFIWPGSIHIWRCWDMTIDSASEVLHDYTKFVDNPILFALFWFSESGLDLIFSRRREVWEVGRHSLSGPGDPWRQWQRIVSQFYCLLSRLLSKQLWSAHTSQCTTLSLTLGFKLERETWGVKVQWFGHIHYTPFEHLATSPVSRILHLGAAARLHSLPG